jgi:peptidoglycan/LPS O-acetylase OafA/YrhL
LIFVFTFIYCGLLYWRWDTFLAANLYVFNYADVGFPGTTPLWSVSLEMHFYIAIALAIGVFGRRGFWLVPVAAIIVTGIRIEAGSVSNIRTHLRVDEILSGSLLALAWLNMDRKKIRFVLAVLPKFFWPLLVLWLLSCHRVFEELAYFRPYFSAAVVGAVLMMQSNVLTAFLSHALMRYIAATSFAVYVLHSPFRVGWFNAGSDWERYLFKRPLGIVCTFVLAHLSTFYFEKPINAWAHRITRVRHVVDDAASLVSRSTPSR